MKYFKLFKQGLIKTLQTNFDASYDNPLRVISNNFSFSAAVPTVKCHRLLQVLSFFLSFSHLSFLISFPFSYQFPYSFAAYTSVTV